MKWWSEMFPTRLALAVLVAWPASGLGAQCPDGSPPPCRAAPRTTIQPTSVAVLYFDNASRDTTDAYLADGLTEELRSALKTAGSRPALVLVNRRRDSLYVTLSARP